MNIVLRINTRPLSKCRRPQEPCALCSLFEVSHPVKTRPLIDFSNDEF